MAEQASKQKKYIFADGVMKLNPEGGRGSEKNKDSLAVLASLDDIREAQATSDTCQLSNATIASLEIIQDDNFLSTLHINQVTNSEQVLENISGIFAEYNIPIGLMNKLLTLQTYRLNFIIDDSTSMSTQSSFLGVRATRYMAEKFKFEPHQYLTRWQEAENRIHIMLKIIANIPCCELSFFFMNNHTTTLCLRKEERSADEFISEAHDSVRQLFSSTSLRVGTPTYKCLSKSFENAKIFKLVAPTVHYLFTDGEPTDFSALAVRELIMNRDEPENNPVNIITCSDDEDETLWLKKLDNKAPFCSEIDDYHRERAEVGAAQGSGFPYTQGIWLMCHLVSALSPDDLGALGDSIPLSKHTLDNLLGRNHSVQEYQYYFERNPHASLYVDFYPQLLRVECPSRAIISTATRMYREQAAGYIDGERYALAPTPGSAIFSGLSAIGLAQGKTTIVGTGRSTHTTAAAAKDDITPRGIATVTEEESLSATRNIITTTATTSTTTTSTTSAAAAAASNSSYIYTPSVGCASINTNSQGRVSELVRIFSALNNEEKAAQKEQQQQPQYSLDGIGAGTVVAVGERGERAANITMPVASIVCVEAQHVHPVESAADINI